MASAAFDNKFGSDLVASAPTSAGVYRYRAEDGSVLYVGKAKNLRRRLANYRNATRKKAHRKMRVLVREAHSLDYETCESEAKALLRENELIRQLEPEYNVDGAYAFLYPSIGLGNWDRHTLICFTTHVEQFEDLDLTWYGCFRSRPRAKAAFTALIELLALVAHREKSNRLPNHPRIKGSRLVGLRRLPHEIAGLLPCFFAGRDQALLTEMARRLLTKPRARRDAVQVEAHLRALADFYQTDAERLRLALVTLGDVQRHVSQDERDALFIRSAHAD